MRDFDLCWKPFCRISLSGQADGEVVCQCRKGQLRKWLDPPVITHLAYIFGPSQNLSNPTIFRKMYERRTLRIWIHHGVSLSAPFFLTQLHRNLHIFFTTEWFVDICSSPPHPQSYLTCSFIIQCPFLCLCWEIGGECEGYSSESIPWSRFFSIIIIINVTKI